MIRIFHPNHGYLLVTDDNEKKRLLETGGSISENFDKLKQETDKEKEMQIKEEHKRGRPKKWQ